MVIEGFNILLRRLTLEDAELVRVHRNSDEIRCFMVFRGYISSEQQVEWFNSINNEYNNYFIIESEGKKVGLIYGGLADWTKMETGNGGIFIWDQNVRNSIVPLAASLLLTDISVLLGFKRTFIRIRKDNKPAIAYNIGLGYAKCDFGEDEISWLFVLESENYLKQSVRLKQKIFQSFQNPIEVICEPSLYPSETFITKQFQLAYKNNPVDFNLIVI